MDETFTIYRTGSTVKVFDENGIELTAFNAQAVLSALTYLVEINGDT